MVRRPDDRRRVLLVNADDFGRSEAINEGVAAGHEDGIVTSASLMVRWPAAATAAAYARDHADLSVGLHLDLGEWVRRDGTWVPRYEIVSTQDAGTVVRELDRQIARFRELIGRPPTHIDSHQHVHRSEPVRTLAQRAGSNLGIPVRHLDPRVTFRGDFHGRGRNGEPTPDAISCDALIALIRCLPPGVSELCCHPAARSDGDELYGPERRCELDALTDPRVKDVIAAEDIELRSFTGISS